VNVHVNVKVNVLTNVKANVHMNVHVSVLVNIPNRFVRPPTSVHVIAITLAIACYENVLVNI